MFFSNRTLLVIIIFFLQVKFLIENLGIIFFVVLTLILDMLAYLPTYILQSISIAIQRGNAASVMETVYNDRKLEEIYNL